MFHNTLFLITIFRLCIYLNVDIVLFNWLISAVNQYYEAVLYDMFVIKGNTAIFKCIVPSFVADYVSVISWEDTIGNKYFISSDKNFGINASYCRFYEIKYVH